MFPKCPREAATLLNMESTMSTKVYAQSEEDKHTQRREPHSERKNPLREKKHTQGGEAHAYSVIEYAVLTPTNSG